MKHPALLVALCAAPALAQSLNVDFAPVAGTPSPSYAAAGLAGVWNALDGTPGPHPLVGLSGAPLPVTLRLIIPYGGPITYDHPLTAGDDQALLDDGVGDGVDIAGRVEFTGLAPGDYTIYTYAWVPYDPGNRLWVWLNDDPPNQPAVVTGPLTAPGPVPGVTHAVHKAAVVDGRLAVNLVSGYWVFSTWWLNGIQLVRETCYPDCNNDGVLNLADFGCFQTRFAMHDPYADCNQDNVVNLADFGCFQTRFALGCP